MEAILELPVASLWYLPMLGRSRSMTFAKPGADAEILVVGSDKGYAELEVDTVSILTGLLMLEVGRSGHSCCRGDECFGAALAVVQGSSSQ